MRSRIENRFLLWDGQGAYSDEAQDQHQSDVLSPTNPTSHFPTMHRRQLQEKLHDRILGRVAQVHLSWLQCQISTIVGLTAMVQWSTAALQHHIVQFKVIHGIFLSQGIPDRRFEELVMSFRCRTANEAYATRHHSLSYPAA